MNITTTPNNNVTIVNTEFKIIAKRRTFSIAFKMFNDFNKLITFYKFVHKYKYVCKLQLQLLEF